jgi:hypothetical protein
LRYTSAGDEYVGQTLANVGRSAYIDVPRLAIMPTMFEEGQERIKTVCCAAEVETLGLDFS